MKRRDFIKMLAAAALLPFARLKGQEAILTGIGRGSPFIIDGFQVWDRALSVREVDTILLDNWGVLGGTENG